MSHPHAFGSDCTLADLGICSECPVYHGEPRPQCDQRGYHLDGPVHLDRLAWEGN